MRHILQDVFGWLRDHDSYLGGEEDVAGGQGRGTTRSSPGREHAFTAVRFLVISPHAYLGR